MTNEQKEQIKTLMNSRRGLVREACRESGVSIDTYYNIINDRSKNFDALNKVLDSAKAIIDKGRAINI